MAQVVVELSADEQKLLNSYRKIQTQQDKVDAGHKKMVSGMNKFNKATQESERRLQGAKSAFQGAFGSTPNAQLLQFAVGMAGVSTAVGNLRNAMQLLREDTERALRVTEELVATGGKMSQIVEGPKRDALAAERMRLGKLSGVPFSAIEDLQFTAQSTGMSDQAVEMITRAAGARVFEIAQAGMVGSEIPLLFGGKATPYQSIAGLSVAAQASPADFNVLAENLQQAAEGTNQAGISPQETIAALAVMREKFKPETAAQRINRFAANLAQDDRFRGQGLAKSVRMLMEMPEEERREFTGESIQMGSAYDALVKLLPRLEERTAAVEAAFQNPNSILNQQIGAATDPRFTESSRMRAWMERNKALRQQEALALSRAGQGGLERQAAAIRAETEAQRDRIDPVSRFYRRQFRNAMVDIGAPSMVTGAVERSVQEFAYGDTYSVISRLRDLVQALDENTNAVEGRTTSASNTAQRVAE